MKTSGRDKLDDWLDQGPAEDALDPALPIIDPHHHLWNRGGHRYMAEELRADLDCGHRFIATGYVECKSHYRTSGPEALKPVGETEFVVSTLARPLQTRQGAVRAGEIIIAYADLAMGDGMDAVIAAHKECAEGRLRGVRYSVAWHESDAIKSHYPTFPGMLALPEVRRGMRRVGAHGLVLDIWAYFTQLSEVVAAADACPEVFFVVNHCGGPIGIGPYGNKRADVLAQWKESMLALSRRDNIAMKLGGLGMPLAGFAFHKKERPPASSELAQAWAPYVLHCIEAFGPERCMFESNWPVDRTAGRYGTLWNAFKRTVADCSPAERNQLFAGTAQRVYRIS